MASYTDSEWSAASSHIYLNLLERSDIDLNQVKTTRFWDLYPEDEEDDVVPFDTMPSGIFCSNDTGMTQQVFDLPSNNSSASEQESSSKFGSAFEQTVETSEVDQVDDLKICSMDNSCAEEVLKTLARKESASSLISSGSSSAHSCLVSEEHLVYDVHNKVNSWLQGLSQHITGSTLIYRDTQKSKAYLKVDLRQLSSDENLVKSAEDTYIDMRQSLTNTVGVNASVSPSHEGDYMKMDSLTKSTELESGCYTTSTNSHGDSNLHDEENIYDEIDSCISSLKDQDDQLKQTSSDSEEIVTDDSSEPSLDSDSSSYMELSMLKTSVLYKPEVRSLSFVKRFNKVCRLVQSKTNSTLRSYSQL